MIIKNSLRFLLLCAFLGVRNELFKFLRTILDAYLKNNFSPETKDNDSVSKDSARLFSEVTDPVIVWWIPPAYTLPDNTVQCGKISCYITDRREFRHHPLLKGFIFYGSSVQRLTDVPLPRNGSSVFWALFHQDISRINTALNHEAVLSLFNYTATFSRLSSFPLTTQYLWDLDSITDLKYFKTTEIKGIYQQNEEWLLAPVVYIQTNCFTANDRDPYVAELSKHIRVDSFGACLHNRNLPKNLQSPYSFAKVMSDEFLYLIGRYKFMIAIENEICEDYISEKLWRPLISGTVPVYIGSPSVADWLPNNRSVILGLNFDSPKELAKYLNYLNTHDEEYNRFLRHKLDCEVTNPTLIQVLRDRRWRAWGRAFYGSVRGDPYDHFECFLCDKAHHPDNLSIATLEHYDCPMPVSILSGKPNKKNEWYDRWFQGLSQAEVFRAFVDSGVSNITEADLNRSVTDFLLKNKFPSS